MNRRYHKIAAALLTAALAVGASACSAGLAQEQPTYLRFRETAAKYEEAADRVLSADGFIKQSYTEMQSVNLRDAEGNIITYYVCQTTYYATDPAEVTGLNVEGIRGVIDPDDAVSGRQRDVNGKPGMIYEKDGRAYLCWTDTPEYSLILEYGPDAVTEAEIVQMAESVEYVGE